jgi:hypothetical protein
MQDDYANTLALNCRLAVESPLMVESRHMKSYFVQTWGCQMNTADSERMLF